MCNLMSISYHLNEDRKWKLYKAFSMGDFCAAMYLLSWILEKFALFLLVLGGFPSLLSYENLKALLYSVMTV